jgi:hypothetical protein
MSINLTPITKAEMMIDRLELFPNSVVKFLRSDTSGYILVHTLTQTDNWSMTSIENIYINVDFLRLLVLDFTGFEAILAQTEAIGFEGIAYKLERSHRPIGLNRVWSFKLEPLSEFGTITIP